MPKGNFNKVALQLYWNRTSTWVSSCKFAAYFENTSERLLLIVTEFYNIHMGKSRKFWKRGTKNFVAS